MNGLQSKLNATNKLSLLNTHNLLASSSKSNSNLTANQNTLTDTNSSLIHSLPYSLVNRSDSSSNALASLRNSFKPLNYNLSNLNQFNRLNSHLQQANSNGVSFFAHHSDLLSNYDSSLLTNF